MVYLFYGYPSPGAGYVGKGAPSMSVLAWRKTESSQRKMENGLRRQLEAFQGRYQDS